MKKRLMILICVMLVLLSGEVSWATPTFKVELIYTVQQGDALINLAHKFGISIEEIRKINHLSKDEFIKVGDRLIIPENYSFKNISNKKRIETVKVTYKVKRGDALYNIARKYNVSIEELRKANGLSKDEFIKAGDKLIIPGRYNYKYNFVNGEDKLYSPKNNELDNYKLSNKEYKVKISKVELKDDIDVSNLRTLNYYIKRGDNLYDLAREFNTSIAVIKKINKLEGNNVIRLGDNIKLPINNLSPKEVIYRTISDKEFELLARLIHGEARGEPYIGQVAVGAVILNRVINSYFPDNISDVIYQPRQFSPVANGQINLRPNRTAYRAARAALRGEDPTRGAQYFYNPRTAKYQWWFKTREIVVKIGNHVFAK